MHRMKKPRFISLVIATYLVLGTAWISLIDPWLSSLGPNLRSPLVSAGLFALATSAMFFMALWAVPAPGAGESADPAAAVSSAFRPMPSGHPRWPRYAVAAVVSLALVAVQPYVLVSHDEQPLLLVLLMLPIMLSAMVGGAGPGLLATAVLAFGVGSWAHPAHPTWPVGSEHDPLQWLLVLVNGVFISVLAQVMQRSLAQAKADRLLLQTVIRSVPDALSVKDVQGHYLFVNPTVESMFGRPAEAIIGQKAEAFIQTEEAAALSSEDQQGLARRAPWSQEHEIVTPQGARQFVTTRGPILDSSQALVGVVSLSRDVTEQRSAKAELERHQADLARLVDERTAELVMARDLFAARERLTRAVADAVPGLVGYWGADQLCRFGNSAYYDWYGKTATQMVGISVRDCLGDTLFNTVEPHIQEALRGHPQRFQTAVRHADGTQRHTLISYIPDTEDGQVRGFTAVVTDVSELKRAELQLVALNAQLAQRAAEAEQATSAKSAFLANLSH